MVPKETIIEWQKKYKKIVFFNQMDDGRFIAYGRDADRIAKADKSIECLCPLDSLTIPASRIKEYTELMVKQGYRVGHVSPI